MHLWSSTSERRPAAPPPPPSAAPGVTHDLDHIQVLRLFVTDTYRWKRDWAEWRIRFAHDEDEPGSSFRDVAALVRDKAAPLCRRAAEAVEIVLYVREEDDLKAVFDRFGATLHGAGRISAIQSRSAYEDAARVAAMLALATRSPQAEGRPGGADEAREAASLPDLAWYVEGHGLARVATAEVQRHRVTVRMGFVNGSEMWLVDVNEQSGCMHFRARADAVSKMGIAMALRAYAARRHSLR
ncbi:MAG: hypothetical protein KGL55_00600 [Rhodospirillales bacterium]|nr:hypothetical protein [Rhodospirillales bacterium]